MTFDFSPNDLLDQLCDVLRCVFGVANDTSKCGMRLFGKASSQITVSGKSQAIASGTKSVANRRNKSHIDPIFDRFKVTGRTRVLVLFD